jgi:RHS repeat-associated protein
MRHGLAVFAAFIFAAIGSIAQAQNVGVEYEYAKKVETAKSVSHLTSTSFGNQTSDATGQTVFSMFDVDLPGNNKLPVRFGRRLPIGIRYFDQELSGLGNWDVEVPYIEGTFSKLYGWSVGHTSTSYRYNRCSHPDAPVVEGWTFTSADIFHGYNIHVPGVLDDTLLIDTTAYQDPTDGKTYPWILKSMDRLGCLPSLKNGYPGEGFVLLTKDGTRYYFDFMVERKAPTLRKGSKGCEGDGGATCASLSLARTRLFLLATRIEDRFGNYVDYQYDAQGRPQSIVASDGRSITAQYGSSSVTVSAHGNTWLYTLQNGHLASVRNPDSSEWKYTPFGAPTQILGWEPGPDLLPSESFNPDDHCLTPSGIGYYWGGVNFEVTHPSGAKAAFELHGKTFYRSRVQYSCNILFMSADGTSGSANIITPNYFDVFSLVKMAVSGAGMPVETTNYVYGVEFYPYCNAIFSANGQPASPACNDLGYIEDPCAGPYAQCTDSVGRWVIISKPDGTKVRKRFGVIHGVNEGQLLAEEILNSQGVVVRRTDYQYLPDAAAASQAFGSDVGIPTISDPMAPKVRPVVSTQIVQDGVIYKTDVQLCAGSTYCFTSFAQPTMVRKWNSLGSSRTDVTEYENNLAVWVLGQTKHTYNVDAGNVVEFEAAYNTQALPIWMKSFGKLRQSIGYHADGTVATVADGKGNVTTLSNWKRGIPQLVRHPVTSEAPEGATESATVNDNGWITSVTDETGAVTGYGYDAMGRLASIVQPTGDGVAYHTTYRSFQPITASDWKPQGFSVGQWRLTEVTGNRTAITYMDALWRPLLSHEYDGQNVAATLRASKTTYDTSGRVSFQSYPSSQTIPGDTGTRTFYDALDRVTRVEQDSEHGALATTTQYLSGLKTLVTNPKGFSTTTSFMAWDQPTFDLPILSEQPEGKVIQIVRHPQFGWPQQLTQRNAANTLSATRRYVYDGNAQLCKTIEPETGVTVMDYDGAGNLAWQAAGLDASSGNYNSLSDCQRVAANGSDRVVTRTYDPRNRLTHLTFPNGLGNQIWTYEKDNLPSSVTAYNDAGNTAPVVTSYTYNKRRLLTGETLAQPGWYSWSVGYAYDGYGHLSTQTYPTGLVVDYAPNPLGQPTKAGTFATGAQYYPNGALKQFTYGNGVVHVMLQNERQLPSRVVNSAYAINFGQNNTNAVLDNANQYDRNGNVTNIWDYARGDGYQYSRWLEYDQLDRLTAAGSVSFGGDHWHRMTYDALDNLKSWKLAGVKDYAEYVYDARNRLTSIRNTAGATVQGLDYDPQGNMNNKNGQIYQFDYGNRLRIVNLKEAYRYDGLGRRVMNWRWPQPGASTGTLSFSMYSQSGQIPYEEDYHGTPTTAKENIYFAGSVIATRENKWGVSVAVKYQHTDALGSPVAVTNASGQLIERMDYEPWGAIIGKPNHNGIGYTGHVMDAATGLTYMQQRYYDQSIGRFLSVDPVTADGGTGANFNRYKYAANNPYRFVDPDGRLEVLVMPGSDAFTDYVNRGISEMRATKEGESLWQAIRQHPKYKGMISEGRPGLKPGAMAIRDKNTPENVGSDTLILISVDGIPDVPTENGDVPPTPGEVIFHELSHTFRNMKGLTDTSPSKENPQRSKEEVRAIKHENKMRREAGRPLRTIKPPPEPKKK